MAIKTQCPHCERPFTLKDELAGKRVTCSGCRRVFPVPAVTPVPAGVPVAGTAKQRPDVDALALSLLADDAAAKTEDKKPVEALAPGKTIAFKCPHCDFVNQFEARFAGKNAPCGGCQRILKVPLPVKEEAKDWRKVAAKPSLARDDAEELEGAWGNVQRQAVSVDALKEADAVGAPDDEPEPRRWGKRIAIVMAALGVFGLLVYGILWGVSRYNRSKLERAMDTALAYADQKRDPKANPKLKSEQAGLIYWLGAKHALSANHAETSKDHLLQARKRLDKSTPEQFAALIEVLGSLADLTGSPAEVTAGARLAFEKGAAQKDMHATIQTHMTPILNDLKRVQGETGRDMRSYAFRVITRRLVARGQRVLVLVNQSAPLDERAEICGVVGLELLAMDKRDWAEEMAKAAVAGDCKDSASLAALWLALGEPNVKLALAPPPKNDASNSAATIIGYSEGLARQGKLDLARQIAAKGKPYEHLRARVAISAAVIETRPEDASDLEHCGRLLDAEFKNAAPPWLMMRLVQISAKANRYDLAARFAGMISDPGLRAWGQYQSLLARLKSAEAENKAAELDWVKEVGTPDQLAHSLAWMAVARYNAHKRGGSDVFREVERWETEELRPFGYAGVALANITD